VTRLVLDAGALVGFERADRDVAAALEAAWKAELPLITSAMIVAQVWRDSGGRQAALARLLAGVEIVPVDDASARAAGILLGQSGTSDAVDAVVALLVEDDDRLLTSDPDDMNRLLTTLGRRTTIVRC